MNSLAEVKKSTVERVVSGGYCIGCGACAVVSDNINMQLNKYGQMIPVMDMTQSMPEEKERKIAQVCPFSGEGKNEEQLANQLFPELPWHHEIGHHKAIYAGRVKADEYFQRGSSGGVGKWILSKLLETQKVDYVLQVTEVLPEDNANLSQHLHYQFQVFDSAEKVISGSKSAYYPVEMSEVLKFVHNNEGRFAITGVPCFIKAIRQLCGVDTDFAEKIKYTLSIVCGHLKTKGYAEMIAWQLGVKPEELAAIDFRKKISGKKANQKGVQAKSVHGHASRADVVQNLFGTNYGHGLFKYTACDYCDDVVGETADVSVGDAWLPQFLEQGTSLVIIRNKDIAQMVNEFADELQLTAITENEAADSQRAGLRHRRDYLKYRLWLKQKAGNWFPEKRVAPAEQHLKKQVKQLVKARIDTAELSHKAFFDAKQTKDFKGFERALLPTMELMSDLRRRPTMFYCTRVLRASGIYSLLLKVKSLIKRG